MRHYNNTYSDPEIGALLCGKAGTITIGHYHQWHSSWGTNHSNKNRYMIKFLLTRTEEPQHPSWNANGIASTDTNDAPTPGQEAVWNHVWGWLSGDNKAAAKNGSSNGNHVSELIGALHDASAPARLNAVYTLGTVGESVVDLLIETLRQTAEPTEITDEPILTHAAYALSAIGASRCSRINFRVERRCGVVGARNRSGYLGRHWQTCRRSGSRVDSGFR